MTTERRVAWILLAGLSVVAVGFAAYHRASPPSFCPLPMIQLGARCCGAGQRLEAGRCIGTPTGCMGLATAGGCVPRAVRVPVAGGKLRIGPIDWEAAERLAPREADVAPFRIDSHEVSEQAYAECVAHHACEPRPTRGEPGLPQTHVTLDDARRSCRHRGGRLPTADELAFAAMGPAGRRYPWGEAGAVCRRAAFGLASGPCASGGSGPQLGGSHPDGATPEGIHDLAGNVAEWSVDGAKAQVRGGSWRSVEASELRSWSYREPAPTQAGDDIGFRCVYPASGDRR